MEQQNNIEPIAAHAIQDAQREESSSSAPQNVSTLMEADLPTLVDVSTGGSPLERMACDARPTATYSIIASNCGASAPAPEVESTSPGAAVEVTTARPHVYISINSAERQPRINRGHPEVFISIQLYPMVAPQQPQVATNQSYSFALPRNYWCHVCTTYLAVALTIDGDRACPTCRQGFIEQLPNETVAESPLAEILDLRPSISRTLQMSNEILSGATSEDHLTYENFRDLQNLRERTSRLRRLLYGVAGVGAALGTGFDGFTPMSPDQLRELPCFNITEGEVGKNVGCTVCQDAFRLGEAVRKLECNHLFHDNCIFPWLRLRNTCPNCRKIFSRRSGADVAVLGESPTLRAPQPNVDDAGPSIVAEDLILWENTNADDPMDVALESNTEHGIRRFSH